MVAISPRTIRSAHAGTDRAKWGRPRHFARTLENWALGTLSGATKLKAPCAVAVDAARSKAQLAVSVTGIAGPGGGTETKPVGLVHMAIAREGWETSDFLDVFPGDRSEVRAATVVAALQRLRAAAVG